MYDLEPPLKQSKDKLLKKKNIKPEQTVVQERVIV